MFEKILLVYSERITKNHLDTVGRIKEIIEKTRRKCSLAKASDLQANLFDNVDLVITVGGDGTFIRASHYLSDIPILGINSEPGISEGALISVSDSELSRLEEILNGNYNIIRRSRIEVRRNGVILDKLALNDVYIGSLNQFHTSRYAVRFQGKEEEQRSSGVLIATSSGSNAWYKSAGGKPFPYEEQELKFLVREPYSGRLFQPKILAGEIKPGEKIAFVSKRYTGGVIALDSDAVYEFNNNDEAEIRLSDKPLNVLVKK